MYSDNVIVWGRRSPSIGKQIIALPCSRCSRGFDPVFCSASTYLQMRSIIIRLTPFILFHAQVQIMNVLSKTTVPEHDMSSVAENGVPELLSP